MPTQKWLTSPLKPWKNESSQAYLPMKRHAWWKNNNIEGDLTRSFHRAAPPKTTNFQWEKKLFETNSIKDMFRLGQILCNNFCRILNSYVGSTCNCLRETVHATANSNLHGTCLVLCAIHGSSVFVCFSSVSSMGELRQAGCIAVLLVHITKGYGVRVTIWVSFLQVTSYCAL